MRAGGGPGRPGAWLEWLMGAIVVLATRGRHGTWLGGQRMGRWRARKGGKGRKQGLGQAEMGGNMFISIAHVTKYILLITSSLRAMRFMGLWGSWLDSEEPRTHPTIPSSHGMFHMLHCLVTHGTLVLLDLATQSPLAENVLPFTWIPS